MVLATSLGLVIIMLVLIGEVLKKDKHISLDLDEVEKVWAPDWSKLGTVKIWRDAVSQVIFISGIGFGPVLYSSNCVTSSTKIQFDYVILIVGSLVSILATGIFCAYLGSHHSDQLNNLKSYEL
jgi:SNF family Na+-dependent transporter